MIGGDPQGPAGAVGTPGDPTMDRAARHRANKKARKMKPLKAQTIGLSMIVKDEAAVIERCLRSVRHLVDTWDIVDTGSSDDTAEIILRVMRGIPGQLHRRPWVDFATNRNEALELARPRADYLLIIDADDVLAPGIGWEMPHLAHLSGAACMMEIEYGGVRYQRPQVIDSGAPWRWTGVVHEFLDGVDAPAGGFPVLGGVRMVIGSDGARRKEPRRFERDAAHIEVTLWAMGALYHDAEQGGTVPSQREFVAADKEFLRRRYTFYLAQSYRDAGLYIPAIYWYGQRAEMGGWNEEVFVSLVQAAHMMQLCRAEPEAIVAKFTQAARLVPERTAEALYGAYRACRLASRWDLIARLEEPLGVLRHVPGGLFVEPWIYEWGLLDEASVCTYWAGYYNVARRCARQVVESSADQATRARAAENMRLAEIAAA